MARRLAVVVTLALPALAVAQRAPRADARPAAYTAVREVDLRRDVGEMAAPGMRGREGGTLDELRASIRVAERYRRIGLEPMGDDGTYFQWFDIVRTRVSATASRIVVDGRALVPFADVVPLAVVPAEATGPVLWVADPRDTTIDVRGRIVATQLQPPAPGTIRANSYTYASRYADAAIAGTSLRFVRTTLEGDSVHAGADDNATVTAADLAAARAFVRQPARRSVLFINHGSEERGLLGSRWHAMHPVLPLERLVAVIDGDMIGRNHPDTAALLGAQPPHRNSTDLVRHALRANAASARFVIDTLWDRPTHPEGWYFRSDHLLYARRGVPALMWSTNLHDDYHTPRDNPANIDYAELTRMAQWMYLTGWYVANAPVRPRVDEGATPER